MDRQSSAVIQVMTQGIINASKRAIRGFTEIERLRPSMSGAGRYSNKAEQEICDILRDYLLKARPAYSLQQITSQGVESIKGVDPLRCWIIKPIDSMENYCYGMPHFCISASLAYKGRIIAAVIYDPIRNELFTAAEKEGTWINGARLKVAYQTELQSSVVGCGYNILSGQFNNAQNIIRGCKEFRCLASSILDIVYVACSRLDIAIALPKRTSDIASSILMLREAGGDILVVSDVQKESPNKIATDLYEDYSELPPKNDDPNKNLLFYSANKDLINKIEGILLKQ